MTPSCPFDFVPSEGRQPRAERAEAAALRPCAAKHRSLTDDAPFFIAGDRLADAINTAIAVGDPLLLTGEPGTGKTQAAYYAAHHLGVECIHFQVKSGSSARDLLYEFDMVRYFRDAHLQNVEGGSAAALRKEEYLEQRALWEAFEKGKAQGRPQVLLIDEIDKAPRDFPNDLLYELDQMKFKILETGDTIDAPPELRPVVFITSNSERRLPEPFLRRCVYHHIEFDDRIVERAVKSRRDDFSALSDEFLALAVKRFLALRDKNLRKTPATGELLVWLRVLALKANGRDPQRLSDDLAQLPHLGVLLKDHQDIAELT